MQDNFRIWGRIYTWQISDFMCRFWENHYLFIRIEKIVFASLEPCLVYWRLGTYKNPCTFQTFQGLHPELLVQISSTVLDVSFAFSDQLILVE